MLYRLNQSENLYSYLIFYTLIQKHYLNVYIVGSLLSSLLTVGAYRMTQRSHTAQLGDESLTWEPRRIQNIEDTGLKESFLQDLALKTIYFRGQMTGHEVASEMHLPFATVVTKIMDYLKREQLCEVRGSGGLGSASYQYSITMKGSARAREQLERTTYIGPAPVPWDSYVVAIKRQGARRLKVNPQRMQQALSHLILEEKVFSRIGPAANSGKSIFLYGPPGNGKTTIAERFGLCWHNIG